MTRVRWFFHRLTTLFRRRQRETDLDAELAFHLDAETADAAEAGLSPSDAAAAARRSLGNTALTREDARAAWTWRRLDEFAQDVRYTARVLRRRPVFTVTVVLTLGLAVGATTALSSLVYNLLLRPLAVERPYELVRITRPNEPNGAETWERYETLHTRSTGFSGIAGMTNQDVRPIDVAIDGAAATAQVQMVSNNFFDVLGARSSVGHLFGATSGRDAVDAVAVVSDDFRRRHFATEDSPLGAIIRVYNIDFRVIGVGASGFRGTNFDVPVDIWVPFDRVIAPGDQNRTRGRWIQMIGRLAPGSSAESASAEVSTLVERPMVVSGGRSGFSAIRERLSQPLLLLGVVVVLVLGVTCANLGNLALAGVTGRARELAVREAVGASRGRVARQLTTEGVVLVAASLTLGFALAPLFSAALLSFLPPQQASVLPNLRFALEWPALTGATGSAVLGLLVIGVLPVARVTRRRGDADSLHAAARSQAGGEWLRRTLMTFEIALCTVLLMTAGVFVFSIRNLHAQDTGYAAHALLIADVQPPRAYTESQRDQLIETLVARVLALPHVEAAAFSHHGQLSGGGLEYPVSVPGTITPTDDAVFQQRISPGFFATMGTRLVAGRDFTLRDDEHADDVAIVNEAFARRYFGRRDPVGETFTQEWPQPRPMLVVGVVADSKWINLRDERPAMYYVPYRQHPGSPAVRLVVRAAGDLDTLGAQLVQTARTIDPQMPLTNVIPFTEVVNRTLVVERVVAHASTTFAIFGLVIASVGLYGSLAFAVVRRTREIGLRIALGASPRSVEWLFLRDTWTMLLVGFAVGVPGAYAVTRTVSSLLFGLEPGDPTTTLAVVSLLAATATLASWIPARRAAAIDPMRALRED